jgi:hypothetical protein
MEKFNKLKQEIKQYNPDALCIVVDDEKFSTPFMLVSTNNMKQKIMLFDGNNGLNRFAEISYSKPQKGIILATFEVDENYQQQGFGKFLFNLASTHADVLGSTYHAGTAHPTAPIKGVSKPSDHIFDDETFDKEQKTINSIYQKLGCTFENENDTFFEQHWKSGDKIKNASPLVQDLAYQIAETYGFTPQNQMQ